MMSKRPAARLPVFTRYHRLTQPPDLQALDDFEEQLLFRSEPHEDQLGAVHVFWLLHEFDESLWILTAATAGAPQETVLAWTNAPNELRPAHVAEQLLVGWLRASERHGESSGVAVVQPLGNMELDFEAVFIAAQEQTESPLHDAAWFNDLELVELLLDTGGKVNTEDQDLRTPLHYAVGNHSVPALRRLLQAGADGEARDRDGATPLDLARSRNLADVVAILSDQSLPADAAGLDRPNAAHDADADEPTDAELASVLLVRGTRWMSRAAYPAAALLLARLMTHPGAPGRLAVRGLLRLAQCLQESGRAPDLDAALRALAEEDRFPVAIRSRALCRRGRWLLKHGRTEPAMAAFQQALELPRLRAPEIAQARLLLARLLEGEGEAAAALRQLNQVLDLRAAAGIGRRQQAYLQRAELRYTEGDARGAIRDFSGLLRSRLRRRRLVAQAFIGRSKCYEELRRPDRVIHDLQQAVKTGRLESAAAACTLHNYGVRCNLRGEPDLASEYFTALLALENADVWIRTNAQVNRGCYRGEQQDYAGAVLDFKAALATPELPDDVRVRALFNLGNARRLQGQHRAALRHFNRVVRLPRVAEETLNSIRVRRAMIYSDQDQPDRALRELAAAQQSSELSPDDAADAQLWTGICRHKLGELDDAAHSFQTLMDLTSASREMRARARWGLGDVRADQGQLAAAWKLLLKAEEEMLALERPDLVRCIRQRLDELAPGDSA